MVTYSPWQDGLAHVYDDSGASDLRQWEPAATHPQPRDAPPVTGGSISGNSSTFGFLQVPGGAPVMDATSCAGEHVSVGSQSTGTGSQFEAWSGTCPIPTDRQPWSYPQGGQGVYYEWDGGTKDPLGGVDRIKWTYSFGLAEWRIFGLDYAYTSTGVATTHILPYDGDVRAGGVDWGPWLESNDLTLTRIEYLGYGWQPTPGSIKAITPQMYMRVVRDDEPRQGWWGNKFPGDASTISNWVGEWGMGPLAPGLEYVEGQPPTGFDLPEHWLPELQRTNGASSGASLQCMWVSPEMWSTEPFTPLAGKKLFAGGTPTAPHLRFHFQSADYRWVYDTTSHAPPCRLFPRDDGLGTSSAARIYPPSKLRQRSNRPNATY